MMRQIIAASLKFRYLVIAIAAALIFFGMLELQRMPVDVFPEFAPPLVEIQTEAPGMSAAEVEALITIQLEDALNGTPNIDVIRSKSVPELSDITLIFKPNTDVLLARQMVQERLNIAIRSLPSWAGLPWMLPPLSATSRVMHIGITSDKYPLTVLSMITEWTIRWHLMAVPGVANVVIWGDRYQQLQVQIDPAKLKQYQVTIDEVNQTVSDALDFGLLTYTDAYKTRNAGFIETPNQRLVLQPISSVIEPKELAKIPIDNKVKSDGTALSLADISQIVWGHQPLIGDGVINAQRGLLLVVEKFPWANTLEVTHGIEKSLAAMRPGLPGINIVANIFRPASFIETSIYNFTRSLVIACALVMAVLLVFLYEWRTTLISLVAIPIALLTALLILGFWHTTLNTMILAGLVIAIGGVVDDAIIDVENIVRRLRQPPNDSNQRSRTHIILNASLEIRGSIIYAVMIDVVVLIPVFLLHGVSKAFFQPLAMAYALALLASMLVALTVTPALCLLLLRKTAAAKKESPVMSWLHHYYQRILARVVHTRYWVIFLVCGLLLLGCAILPLLGQSLFPAFKERYFLIHWVTEPGTSDNEVVRMTTRLNQALQKIHGVRSFGSHIGRAVQGEEISGVNFAENWINMDPAVDYDKTLAQIENTVAAYPGLFHDVQTYLNERIDEVLAGSSYPIVVRIYGSDWSTLGKLAEQVRQKLALVKDTRDVHTEFQVEIPQIQVKVDLKKAAQYGVKPGDIRREVATLIAGTEVSDIHKYGKVYGVVVWGTPDTRTSVLSIRELLISTRDKGMVPLKEVADVNILPTPNLIERENNSRRIDVNMNSTQSDLGDTVKDVAEELKKIAFPLGYHAEILGEYPERQAAQSHLFWIGIAAAIAVLLLLQAAFRSWRLAWLAFFTLPSALVGGLLAVLCTNQLISLGSLVGFFTVFGIAARNGIMMINHYQYIETNENEAFDLPLILRGATERLRPILMTALAAGFALIPLVISGNIPGQEIEYPMAIVILGGLITSTLLNLFIVPALYWRFGKNVLP